MTCNTERLSDYLDDELTAEARRDVDQHLAGCGECREVLAELALVKDTAGELAGDETLPERDLWPGVEWRMRGRRSGVALTWAQAMAAGLALVALSGGAVWMTMRGAAVDAPTVAVAAPDRGPDIEAGAVPVRLPDFADEAFDNAVKDLRSALDEGRNRLDPQTIQVLERNLAAIDQAIDQARAALEADPANVSLTSYLASVRRRKLDLLRTAGELLHPAL